MLDGEPHYTALQIAEMRSAGDAWDGERDTFAGRATRLVPPPPLGLRRREGVSARSPADEA